MTLVKKFWRHNGGILTGQDGKPLLCDCCPCLAPRATGFSYRYSAIDDTASCAGEDGRPDIPVILRDIPSGGIRLAQCTDYTTPSSAWLSFSYKYSLPRSSHLLSYPFFALYAGNFESSGDRSASYYIDNFRAYHRTPDRGAPPYALSLICNGEFVPNGDSFRIEYDQQDFSWTYPWYWIHEGIPSPVCPATPDGRYSPFWIESSGFSIPFFYFEYPCASHPQFPDPTSSSRAAMLRTLEQEMEDSQ